LCLRCAFDMSANVKLGPILTAHLFSSLEKALIDLLRSLSPDEWEKQTLSPKWKVKDVAAHLLDTHLRRVTACRDGYAGEAISINSQTELAAFVNRLNQEGVRVYRRLSPELLISLMELASRQACLYFESLDPFATSRWAVSWAGERESANWFDTAREFTERWHHQQQIRVAVDKPGIVTPGFYYPVLDCFMRAAPHHYRTITREPGSLVRFDISGECGGSWYMHRNDKSWELLSSPRGKEVSVTAIPQEIAWRIFTRGIDPDIAQSQVAVSGEAELGLHILRMISIVA